MGNVVGISDGLERMAFCGCFAFGFVAEEWRGEGSIAEGWSDRVDSDFRCEFGGEGFG